MKWKNNLLMGVVICLVLALFSAKTMAVPKLGVATDGPYYYTPPDTFTSYQDDWATSGIATSVGQDEGFEVNSGDTLYLWVTSNNQDQYDPYFYADIYLFAEDDFTNVSFGGAALADPFALTGNKDYVAAYDNPYSGINLGPVKDDTTGSVNTGWEELSAVNSSANGYPGITYVYTGVIEFNLLGEGGDDYFFLAADLNRDGDLYDNGQDGFSSKTSSAVTPVPEPATIALLGIGLAGLAGAEARRRRKKKAVGNS